MVNGRNAASCFFTLLAALFTAAAVCAAFFCRDQKPVLLSEQEEAVQLAQKLMDAVCEGDFSRAETMLYGTAELGADRIPEDPIGAMVWSAYLSSLDYELVGELYTTQTGIAQDVKLISMELATATEHLGSRARELLNEAVRSAEDVSELYDETNAYREELVMAILQEAARQALEEDVRYTYQVFPLQLVYSEGQWRGIADQAFLRAVSGGITG